jgi:hypothetical protein
MGVAKFLQGYFKCTNSDRPAVYQKPAGRIPKTGSSYTNFCESCVHATAMCDTFSETRQIFLSCGTKHVTIAQPQQTTPTRGAGNSWNTCIICSLTCRYGYHSIARATRSTGMPHVWGGRTSQAQSSTPKFSLREHEKGRKRKQ